MVGGSGMAYTPAEKTAAASGAALTQSDPLPQMIFRIGAKPGAPLLLRFPIRVRSDAPK
jgi:hypothetical protein